MASLASFPLRIAEDELRPLPAECRAEMIRYAVVDRIIDHLKLTFVDI